MIKKILLFLVILVAGFSVYAATRPSDFKVSRSTTISAPPAKVFAQVNDFHKWDAWNPWAKMDPNAKNTFEGAASGQGAGFRWAGNRQVGEGSMTILESKPNEKIQIQLDFLKPFKGTNMAEFTFQPQGDKTAVTWTMTGKKNFIAKAIGVFMDCDKMIGDQFEKGLVGMKQVSEAP
ncbi:MAG: SRPBCC family protein [bacterium]